MDSRLPGSSEDASDSAPVFDFGIAAEHEAALRDMEEARAAHEAAARAGTDEPRAPEDSILGLLPAAQQRWIAALGDELRCKLEAMPVPTQAAILSLSQELAAQILGLPVEQVARSARRSPAS